MEIAAPRPARCRSHVKGTDEIAEKASMFRRFRAECPRNAPRFASIAVFAFSSDYRLPYYATIVAYRDIEITQHKCCRVFE